MTGRSRSVGISRSALAGVVLAMAAVVAAASEASAQRGSRGTASVPRTTTAPPPRPSAGPAVQPARSSISGRSYMGPGMGSGSPRRGDLPRLVTEPQRRGYAYTYDRNSGYRPIPERGSRHYRHGVSIRSGRVGSCVFGCSGLRAGVKFGRFSGSFVIGYPFFVPVVVPYYHVEYEHYDVADDERYSAERPASKLIVVGGGSGGGSDALTVESLGDSVRLSWLANGRQAREVKLFVADSLKRELATRSASPSSPTATFEVATLSAPVAFAGVTVVFADGVTSTTLVPYRSDLTPGRNR